MRSKQDARFTQGSQIMGTSKAWLWTVMLSTFLQDPCPVMLAYSSSCPGVQPPHVGLWLSKNLPEQWLETGKFTLQTRLVHLYSNYLLYLGLSKTVSSADAPCANGGGKLISKVCMPETQSTVTSWCVANAGPPRSQLICGRWMSMHCCLFATSGRQQYALHYLPPYRHKVSSIKESACM